MFDKKIALISLYSDDVGGVPPLGSLYLATALKKKGFEAKIFHKNSLEKEKVLAEVIDYNPDLVGMSVFTGYNNKSYADLSRVLKQRGHKIVWGNAHPSLLPEQVLKSHYVDFIVIGEGEETLAELVEKLGEKKEYITILGLGFKEKGKIIINERRPNIDIDDYLIDWSLINVEDYVSPYFSNRYQRVLAVTSSRGCPYNCQFCYNLVFNKRKWRGHSAEKFIENLKAVIEKYKIDAIRFLDDNFFVDKERAFKIVRGLGLPYFADSRVEYVDKEFVRNLKETRCQEIMFGFESGSERILREVVQKGSGTDAVEKAVTLLQGTGIMASGSIIFGFPTEIKKEYKLTMEFIVKLLEINNNLAFTCGWFLPYPGTGLYQKAIEAGFIPPKHAEEWDKFDRWRNDYEMEWIAWDYKKAVKYSRVIVHLLALAHKRNIPLLKKILKWRVRNLNFSLPIDIFIFSRLRRIYFDNNKNIFKKIIKNILLKIIKFTQKNEVIDFNAKS